MIVRDTRGYRRTTTFGDAGMLDAAMQAGMNTVMDSVISVMRASITTTRNLATAAAYASSATEPGWLDALLTPVVSMGVEFAIGAPQNRRDAYLSALNTYTTVTNKLDGPDRADVLAGNLPLRKWLDAALIVQEGIFGVLQDAGQDMAPAADLWNAIQTSYNWVDQHKDIIPDPFDPWTYVKWGIPILLGVAVIGGVFARVSIGSNPVTQAYRRFKRAA